jgi:hypothetical protein
LAVVDLPEFALGPTVPAEIVLESVETTLLLRLALQMVGDDSQRP